MTKSQRLQVEAAELRAKINGLPETRESKTEHDELRAKLAKLDKELAEALATEGREIEREEREQTEPGPQRAGGVKGETAEFRQLVRKASVGRIVTEVAAGRGVINGAEAELQAEMGVENNWIPLRMLWEPGDELRAAASFGANAAEPGSSPGIAPQVFGASIAQFANVFMETVPVGTRTVPVFTTGARGNVSAPAKAAEVSETSAVLAVKEMKPARLQVQLSYALEDFYTYPELDNGFRRNIRDSIVDEIDDQLLNAALKGLLTTAAGPDPTPRPADATTAVEYIAAGAAADGRHAANESEVKLLVGTGAGGVYPHMAATPVSTNGDRRVSEVYGPRLRVSPHVAVADGQNRQQAVAILGSGVDTRASMWAGIMVERDAGERKAYGEVQLWGVAFFDFQIINASAYNRHEFRTS